MDCDTGQSDLSSQQYGAQDGKQYSLLQNVCATYALALKEEEDLSAYKMQPDVLNGQYSGYDVSDSSMMLDVAGANDPLQFSATLTFSAETASLLENFGDAADLFLPKFQAEENPELLDETLHSPASAGSAGMGADTDFKQMTPIESGVEPFSEHSINISRFDSR